MSKNEAKKTMRFWIFSGVVAMLAAQIPFLLKILLPPSAIDQAIPQQPSRKWIWLLLAIILILLAVIVWLAIRANR
ncbi:hypothetical protein [Brevibacillus fulvus]|uniref:Uncharacterized membrane protein YhaH (DUF805 family) n=1 Tax=Brevibacillus fulvus TaxID=1125967 RepID=A0A938Y0V2_9BACL|nr:hypothetical protein [Brevibacillus fulvus]MBM7589075.1 uncharacterized membrane protein YhaH (DUF805 family) [Brevibacillus fulvus]